jgi:hypothetical protein
MAPYINSLIGIGDAFVEALEFHKQYSQSLPAPSMTSKHESKAARYVQAPQSAADASDQARLTNVSDQIVSIATGTAEHHVTNSSMYVGISLGP